MIFYRLISNKASCYAYNWWENTYAQFMFPNAKLKYQRLSEFYSNLGIENNFRLFFLSYLNYIDKQSTEPNILIDSTGLPNNIKIPITGLNNHNGKISNKIRLIIVTDKVHGFPIYFRYVPGNIVDVSTLYMVLNELKEYNINIDQLILDAGYYSESNILELVNNNIKFMTRMKPGKGLYEQLILNNIPDIKNENNYVTSGQRHLFVKKVPINIFKSKIPVYSFICLDIEKKCKDESYYYKNLDNKTPFKYKFLDELKHGVFILISTIDLNNSDVLPTYYTRQSVEQMFDFLKNEVGILPLRRHSEETFSGYLLLSFLSTIAFAAIDKKLKEKNFLFSLCLDSLSNLHAKKYINKLILDVPVKKVNDIAKVFKISIPKKILLPLS
jgi:transposase